MLEEAGFTPEVLAQIDELLVGCGGFARELIRFTGGASTVKDDPGQRLSAADVWIDQLLRDGLTRLVPGCSGYSEEAHHFGDLREGLHVRWMLDPIDGTRPALLGGAFAISAGGVVLQDRRAVAAVGWLYVPTLSALYRGILAPGRRECTLNGVPVAAETGLTRKTLSHRYLVVNSDWHSEQVPGCTMKVSAPGATAVHLTQLVQPAADVAAVLLSRYHPYDAAAGLAVALAGDCALFPVTAQPERSEPLDLLEILTGWCGRESIYADRYLVATPEVAALLA